MRCVYLLCLNDAQNNTSSVVLSIINYQWESILITKVSNYLASILAPKASTDKPDSRVAIASLLCAVAFADHDTSAAERAAIKKNLLTLLKVNEQEVDTLMQIAEQEMLASNSIFDFTSLLSELDQPERSEVIEMMWRIAYADGHLDEIEEAIIRRVAGLLYVPHSEFIRTKLKVLEELA